MKKIMLIGKQGCGKTSLMQRLLDLELNYAKTQSICYEGNILDTPGEYLENKRYFNALLVSSIDFDIIAFLQEVDEEFVSFPAGFASMFFQEVIGIVSKVDDTEMDVSNASNILNLAGCTKIFYTSSLNDHGLGKLKEYLKGGDSY